MNCRSHAHPFLLITEPGSASIFAGRAGQLSTMELVAGPSTASEQKVENTGGRRSSDGLFAPSKVLKDIKASSMQSWVPNLLDKNSDTFWQSCGNQGKHWILLEMQPNIVIEQVCKSHLLFCHTFRFCFFFCP